MTKAALNAIGSDGTVRLRCYLALLTVRDCPVLLRPLTEVPQSAGYARLWRLRRACVRCRLNQGGGSMSELTEQPETPLEMARRHVAEGEARCARQIEILAQAANTVARARAARAASAETRIEAVVTRAQSLTARLRAQHEVN